jgi:hypothetical protein
MVSVVTVLIIMVSVVTVIIIVASAVMVVIMPEAPFVLVNSGLCFVVVGSRRRAARASRWRPRSY